MLIRQRKNESPAGKHPHLIPCRPGCFSFETGRAANQNADDIQNKIIDVSPFPGRWIACALHSFADLRQLRVLACRNPYPARKVERNPRGGTRGDSENPSRGKREPAPRDQHPALSVCSECARYSHEMTHIIQCICQTPGLTGVPVAFLLGASSNKHPGKPWVLIDRLSDL